MIRILIVDDQNIVRQGLQALLDPRSNLKVVGTAEDGESAIEQVRILRPDVVLIDIEMPVVDGITATQEICQKFSETKVIVLSSHENKEYVGQALRAGAEGYLLKNTLAENLEQAICSVYQGQLQIEPQVLKKVIAESTLNFATVSEQNVLAPVVQQPSKIKVNADNSTTAFKANNIPQVKTPDNTLNNRETKKLQLEKLKLRNEISLTSFRSRNNSKSAIVSALLIVAATSIYFFNKANFQSILAPEKPEKVDVLPVKIIEIEPVKSYQTSQTYTGEVAALRTSEVGFERGGKLINVFVKEGDLIFTGTPLAELDTANLKAQRRGLMAQKEQAQAVLAELKNGARNEQISAAQANVKDIQQQLKLETLKSDRRKYLYEEGAISQEQLDEVTFNQKALTERLANAQSSLQELQNGTRIEQVDAQEAAVDRLDAEIADINITINKSIIKSPFNGTVSARNLDEGTVVKPGTSILRLVESIQFKVKIGVPIAVADQIQPGSEQQIIIAGKEYDSTVDSILPEVNATTRTRTVVFKLPPSATTQVSPKQIALLNVIQSKDINGYWLPINALVKGNRGLWSCYALVDSRDRKNKQAERRYVELLETQENRVLVRGTIKPGDKVIADGVHRLVPGQLVKLQ